jgi:hypothetical protein
MKLYALSLRLNSNIRSFLRKLDKSLPTSVVADKADRIYSLIVLGDGMEDAKVVALTCHHLDGEKTVSIVKPELKRYEAIENVRRYLDNKKYGSISFVLDQEGDKLDKLYNNLENRLTNSGIRPLCPEIISPRQRVYNCSIGSHEFRLIVVVNGIDEINSDKHTIEDHLIKIAGAGGEGDSKNHWTRLTEAERLETFRKILKNKDIAEKSFQQHFKGIKQLDC